MTFSVLQKKSETSYKFIELSKEKGEMVPALSPLLNHSIEISSDWCFTSLQDVVMTLWSGSTASSEPCSSPPVIFHISDYQLHLRQHQRCDTRSYSDCPRFSPAHRWDATQSVEEQERVKLPEIHFFSPEADLLFFPLSTHQKRKGHCHEKGLDCAGTGVEWKWLCVMSSRQIPGCEPPPPLSTHFLCLQQLLTSAGIPSLTHNFLQLNLAWVEIHWKNLIQKRPPNMNHCKGGKILLL